LAHSADAQMTCRNSQVFRVLGSTLGMKAARADSSSRCWKDLICREEKRKAAWRHAWGPRNWWACGSGWKLGFYSFFYCLRVEMSLRCTQKFPGKKKCLLRQLSPFGTSCSLSFTALVFGLGDGHCHGRNGEGEGLIWSFREVRVVEGGGISAAKVCSD
jgi:hypothetical protein